jgi:hypothetical protein
MNNMLYLSSRKTSKSKLHRSCSSNWTWPWDNRGDTVGRVIESACRSKATLTCLQEKLFMHMPHFISKCSMTRNLNFFTDQCSSKYKLSDVQKRKFCQRSLNHGKTEIDYYIKEAFETSTMLPIYGHISHNFPHWCKQVLQHPNHIKPRKMTYTAVSLTGPLGIRPNYRYSRRISTFLSLHVRTSTHIKCPVLHYLCIWFPLSIINSKKLLSKEQSKINTSQMKQQTLLTKKPPFPFQRETQQSSTQGWLQSITPRTKQK